MRLILFPWERWIWLRATVVAGEESAGKAPEHNGMLWQEVKSDRLAVVDQLKKYLGRIFPKSFMSSRGDYRAGELKAGLYDLSFLYDLKNGPKRELIDFCMKMDLIVKCLFVQCAIKK
ncbi:hypothetical protein AVEN_200300-1 [Araneus ventricosus]|uniref:Uncharacterized protein n=1 Tax=Araneus ventricosus TaxID=182803 RepID=A0A4Y2UJT6_ARAVE|nr:hypothetical protein AVEN_200300-1 [Araneus ventricosus]